jgi:L-ascorbate metabolism protein UlaG (beta-lactamase superfamily)
MKPINIAISNSFFMEHQVLYKGKRELSTEGREDRIGHMEITYIGHSCFKLRGKGATVVTDPFESKSTGLIMPKMAADIVTVSHQHEDHNAVSKVTGTARREKPYVITAPGEYEISGVGVFGWSSFHDDQEGKEHGKNTMYTIMIDRVSVCHLGDLGGPLTNEQVEGLGVIDVLLVPVGGVYTIDTEVAAQVVGQLTPSFVIPMHYRTPVHNAEIFGKLQPVETFFKAMGAEEIAKANSLTVQAGDSREETEVVWLRLS